MLSSLKTKRLVFPSFLALSLITSSSRCAEFPQEKPLWDDTALGDQIVYDEDEKVREHEPSASSPSGSNRVFSYVSKPTYSIHRPTASSANGVALVICPGGAYRDVWLDREGHDLAMWLKERGITSLVLKYRTNAGDRETRAYQWQEYLPAVQADARQAIRILRRDAAALKIDREKIGICGFSAGGHLALSLAFNPVHDDDGQDVSGAPNFAGLFYPWLRDECEEVINKNAAVIPPLFIMNAADDRMTPATRCIDFYLKLLQAGVKAEFHVFGKGSHGFDLGDGRGASAAIWKNSFVAWLTDTGFID